MQTIYLTKQTIEMILSVKTVLEEKYYNHYTHQELAQMAGTSESQLRRGFKLILNKTINEYQSEIRVKKAKELLERSELTLNVIAIRIGLDRSNLLRTFKKATGYTPKQWRIKSKIDLYVTNKSNLGPIE